MAGKLAATDFALPIFSLAEKKYHWLGLYEVCTWYVLGTFHSIVLLKGKQEKRKKKTKK